MTPEELLRPRFMILYNDPYSQWGKGNVFTVSESEAHHKRRYNGYRELKWWEGRKLADLPEYLKLTRFTRRPGIPPIVKVKEYTTIGYYADYGPGNEPPKDPNSTNDWHCSFDLDGAMPATKEEYDEEQAYLKRVPENK